MGLGETMNKQWRSEGNGEVDLNKLKKCGNNVIIESGVRIFHPENIEIGDNVYIGHDTILKGYYKGKMTIGSNVWIGQGCYFHSAGGLEIGENVGIGPMVKIITSEHEEVGREVPILFSPLAFEKVTIEKNCDIGMGTIILKGVTIEEGSKIGAGAVVTQNIPKYSVAVGIPAKVIKYR